MKKLAANDKEPEGKMKKLAAELQRLQVHPLLLEVTQLFRFLERDIVLAISEDASFLSQVDKKNDATITQWEDNFSSRQY